MDYKKVSELLQKNQNSNKSKYQKISEKLGYEFDDKGNILVNLTSPDGTEFGKVTYDAMKAIEGNTLDSYTAKNDVEKSLLKKYRQHQGFALRLEDGTNFGNVSYDAYKAIENNTLESYKPKNEEEKKIINEFKKQLVTPFAIEVDGETKDFGNISYDALEYFKKHGTFEPVKSSDDKSATWYTPNSEAEKKTIEAYKKFAEEYAKKQREPENIPQGILHSLGYTLEKIGSGILGTVDNTGDYITAGGMYLFGNKEGAKQLLERENTSEKWSRSAEERYRVPDWLRNVGGVAESAGNMVLPIIAEIATAPVGGASPLLELELTRQAAKTGIKGTIKSVAKNLSTKLVKPKVSDVLFGLSAAGSGANVAVSQSADIGNALRYGALTGLGEVATEKLFGGFAGTGIGADELIDISKIKGISKLASTKYGKKVLDVAFEGVEEVIMTDLDPWFQKLTIDPDAKISNLTESKFWKDRGEAFAHGMLLSGLMNAGTFAVNKTASAVNKRKAIKTVNNATNSINALFESEADKFVPLKNNATIEEIKQRQNEIGVFTIAYADLMVEELVKSNPEVFSNIERVSVGDTFEDTKTGNIIKAISRDDAKVTFEVETPNGTITRAFTHEQIDNFVKSDQIIEIDSTENSSTTSDASTSVYNMLTGEKLTNKVIDNILNTTELKEAFEKLSGVEIKGTKAEQRAIVRNFRKSVAEKTTTANTPQANSGVRVGDIYRNDKTSVLYTIVSKDETTTTVRNGLNSKLETMSNESADFVFNNTDTTKGDTFRKIQGTTTTEASTTENVSDTTEADVAVVVDAVNETLRDGALEGIYASMENQSVAPDISVFADSLISLYKKLNNIGHIAGYFTDGGAKVISAIKSTMDTTADTKETVSNKEKVEAPQTETSGVQAGDVYVNKEHGTIFTITDRDDKNTTYTVKYSSGHTSTTTSDNATADLMFDDDAYEKKETVKTNTSQTETSGIKVGDVYQAGDMTYTVTARDSENTTFEIKDKDGNVTTTPIDNESADAILSDTESFTKVKEGKTPKKSKRTTEEVFIDDRTWEDASNRRVNAFQYDNPEVKAYYKPIAKELLSDVNNTIKGERYATGDFMAGTQEFTGISRFTSESIARIKDDTGATYDKIEDALKRIINDEGQENIALAKKIEFVIDDMLSSGYTDFEGNRIPADEDYIALKEELKGEDVDGEMYSVSSSNETESLEIEANVGYNGNTNYSLNDADYLKAVENGDMETAQKMVDEVAKESGYNVKAYHGTSRADRVGNVFLPERATSGPMAYFTDSKEIASNYARDKADTSLAYDEEYDSYYTQFRVNRGGKSISIPDLWKYLSITQKNKIREIAGHIKFDDDYENIIVDESAKHGNGAYDAYTLNMHRGNVLEALVDTWLDTGDLYRREADFLEVLKLVGIEDAEYRDPDARQEKVYDTWLKIQKPFDTELADKSFYDSLSKWIETHDMSVYEKETSNADMWDKNNQTPETWLEKLNADIENGTTHAWTVIPDFVTDYLKEQHYDGIKDKGGKGGGEGHTVWIPFSSEQIKSAEPVTYDNDGNVIPLSERFNEQDNDIRYSVEDYAPTFYSHMGKTIDGIKQDKIGANSVVNYLKGKGVKDEEIKWSGIETFLEGKKSVTKAELQEFVAGSQLQIEEVTRDYNEIPYTQEQTEQIAKYESQHDEIVKELKKEWKKVIGTDIPITHFNYNLEDKVFDSLIKINAQIKESTDVGKEMVEAREQLRELIAKDDFGYDSANEAYYYATRDPQDFLDNYDFTDEERAIFERFISAQENWKNAEGIPIETQKHLKNIAAKADDIRRKISRINDEHYNEVEKHKPKWDSYKLDGGENYREVIFKLPNSEYSNFMMQTHWGEDAQGILAHARVQDFEVNGKKMLFIEEIQSDWHNEGHKKGYITSKDADIRAKRAELVKYINSRLGKENSAEELAKIEEARDEYIRLGKNMSNLDAVPDVPFKDNYHEYVLKSLIRMAAEQGYDSIGWTPADVQSKRWSGEFAEGYRIEYDQDIPKFLNKYGKKWGTKVGKNYLSSESGDVLYTDNNGNEYGSVKEWYQSVMDDYASSDKDIWNDYISGKFKIIQVDDTMHIQHKTDGNILEESLKIEYGPVVVWSMPITDSMKESVLYEGQPLYSVESEENANEQRRNDLLSGNSRRGNDASTRKWSERISSFKQKNKGKNATERQSFAKELLEQGKADEVIDGKNKYTLVNPEAYNDDMLAMVEEAKAKGIELGFFLGEAKIKFDTKDEFKVNGIKKSGSKLLVRYDGKVTPQKLLKHETIHAKWRTKAMQSVKNTILNSLSEDEKNAILSQDRYAYYKKVYKGNMDKVWQEFVADVMADMNEYTANHIDAVADYWYGNESAEVYSPSTYAESIDAGGDERYSAYGYPRLNNSEWALLNNRLEIEIRNDDNFIDEYTKWLYASKNGTRVFAIYGIGRGEDATPLLAVGGSRADSYRRGIERYLEGRNNGSDRSRTSIDRRIRSLLANRGKSSDNLSADGDGRTKVENGTVYNEQRESNGKGIDDRSTENSNEVSRLLKDRDNLGYHAGDLGKAESLGTQSGGRGTGHFGTGTYFVGNKEVVKDYNKRDGVSAPQHAVDFSNYNMFKPKNYSDGVKVHDFLGTINNFWRNNGITDRYKSIEEVKDATKRVDEIFDDAMESLSDSKISKELEELVAIYEKTFGKRYVSRQISNQISSVNNGRIDVDENPDYVGNLKAIEILGDWAYKPLNDMYYDLVGEYYPEDIIDLYDSIDDISNILGVDSKDLKNAIDESIKEVQDLNLKNEYKDSNGNLIDSVSTRVMKKLGFGGVDVRGIEGLDNTTYGSVIYDLEDDTILYSLATDGIPDLDDLWDIAIEKYGTIPKGEKPARDIDVPKRISEKDVVSQFARTVLEAGVTPEWAVSDFEDAILNGEMTHEVIPNKKAHGKAIANIKKLGFEGAMRKWSDIMDSEGSVNEVDFAMGLELYNQCITNKDVRNAMKIVADLCAEATRSARNLQLVRLLKKMTPDGQLYYLEKSIQRMNEEFKEQLGDKFKDIELDEGLMEEFFNETDEVKRDEIYDEICQHIADQIPTTLKDKWDSWRYLAMLGNPRTHIRNLTGNLAFVPAVRMKNFIAATIESGLAKSGKMDASERTKSVKKSEEAKAFAEEDSNLKEVEKLLQGVNGKYAVTGDIESKRAIFKTKWLEKSRTTNFDWLEGVDMKFLKFHYKDALARLITVRNLDVNSIDAKTLDKIRQIAVNEAKKATFRDANVVAEALSSTVRKLKKHDNIGMKSLGYIIEGIQPFIKTPMNIAKQSVYYSPAGLVVAGYNAYQMKKGADVTISDVVDDISKGLTGTAMMLFGYVLSALGILKGGDDEDKKKKAFDELTGEQSYSLNLFGHSYTIDWMIPSSISFFVGSELFNLTRDEFKVADVINAMSSLTDPLLELSVFSGYNKAIKAANYSDINPIVSIMVDALASYVTQGLPTIGGQMSRLIDKNKREYYYIDKTSDMPVLFQRLIGQASSKIPFLSYLYTESVDEWGRDEEYGGVVERAIENTVSPGYYAKENYTEIDKEIKRLYDETGSSSVLPVKQAKYFKDGDTTYYLSAEEYADVLRNRGKKSSELLSELFANKKRIKLKNSETGKYSNKLYSEWSDSEKARAIQSCYEDAAEYAKAKYMVNIYEEAVKSGDSTQQKKLDECKKTIKKYE